MEMGVLTIKNKEVWIKHILKGESFFVTHNNNNNNIQIAYNNKPCKFEMENGKVIKVEINGKVIYGKEEKKTKDKQLEKKVQNSHIDEFAAKAPYNFIPLNDKVVESEYRKWEKIPGFKNYDDDKLTGYINLKIETKTPVYIRDMKEINDKEDYQPTSFFFKDNEFRIPGSSLRGLTRTMVEILSFGKFGFTEEERRFYFRAVGDTSSRGIYYKKIMIDENDGCYPKIKAGILVKKGMYYYIKVSNSIYRINYDIKSRNLIVEPKISLRNFEFRTIYFKPEIPVLHKQHQVPLKYALITKVSTNPKPEYKKGYIVSSGDFGKKKHMHWIIDEPGILERELNEKLIDEYINDESRDEKTDLLKMLEKNKSGVPCFFVEDESGNILAFGHTGMFRLPYSKSIKDHIPVDLTEENTLDITAAIFGDEKHHAGRVYFEDAFLSKEMKKESISMNEITPQILSGPKPTTFQQYLEQVDGIKTDTKKLKHWNDEANIRGNKMYWHKNVQTEKEFEFEGDKEKFKKVTTKITSIKSGTKFNGRIRFENLSEIELGALLFALELPKNHYHKIGMAKPLGLGSIEITPELVLTDRNGENNRYKKLFDDDSWHLAENSSKTQEFKGKFEEHIKKETENNVDTIWNIPRLKQLKIMLDWNNTKKTDWKEKTRYFKIGSKGENEFKDRKVLPLPDELIK